MVACDIFRRNKLCPPATMYSSAMSLPQQRMKEVLTNEKSEIDW